MSYELPKLENWNETRDTLQKISHLLKEFQKSSIEPKKLSLEHSVKIYPKGIFVEIASKGHLYYNFAQEKISFKVNNMVLFKISTKDQSLNSIGIELVSEFKKIDLELSPDKKKMSSEETLKIENKIGKNVATTFWKMYSALARVKAELFGATSPLVIWTHHFDLAFLYFTTENLTESDPTIAFGFAPYSDSISRPYAYMYSWNGSAYVELDEDNLFEKSTWWDKGWKGVVFPYDDMISFQDPIKQFEDFFRHTFRILKEII